MFLNGVYTSIGQDMRGAAVGYTSQESFKRSQYTTETGHDWTQREMGQNFPPRLGSTDLLGC